MTDYTTFHRETDRTPQDIDDLIFGEQTDLCVSER